jgi:membrane protein DedA with SNARE-associated domain
MDTSSTIAMFLHFGLAGIGCLAIAEKFIPAAAVLCAADAARPDGPRRRDARAMTILATSAGSVVGAIGWYGLGRTLGSQRIERLVARFGKFVLLRPSLYRQLTDAYRGNHFWVTLIGQILPTVRIYLALPAGVLRLEPRAFVMATAIGTVIWNMPFLSLGYALRGSGHDPVSLGFWVVVALIAVEVALFLGFRLYKRSLAPRHLAQPRALPARVPLEEGA